MSFTYTLVEHHNNKIIDIYYDKFGKKHYESNNFCPVVGIDSDEETKWKDLCGKNVQEKKFDTIGEYFNFIRESTRNYGSDDAELMFPIYGIINPAYQYINEKYSKSYEPNLNHINIAIIDIEVYCDEGFPDPEIAAWPITSISIKHVNSGKFYVASTKSYDKYINKIGIDPKKINFKHYNNDKGILEWLVNVVRFLQPDILCGWYSDNFDFPYIINRYDFVFDDETLKKKLSPIGKVYCNKLNNRDFRCQIGGITLFDYMRLYKKYIFTPRESYSLDFICQTEDVGGKLDYSEYDNLFELWNNNPQKYIDYNIQDVELVDLLNDKLQLIKLACTVAYKAKCNFIDVMGTIRVWDVLFYNSLKEQNIMVPPPKMNHSELYTGGYVKEPVKKIYDWVVSYDLNSLYPHIQQQWGISPECLVTDDYIPLNTNEVSQKLLNKEIKGNSNYILAANGHYFRKDKEGFIPKILKEIYSERSSIKKEMLSKKQELVYLKEEMKKRGMV